MAPRRSHKKSRTGCQRCKRRRIKCDETHPSCGNCVKHAIACDFSLSTEQLRAVSQELHSPSQVATTGQVIPSSSAPSPATPLPPPVPTVPQSSASLPTTLAPIVSANLPPPTAPSPGVHDPGHIPTEALRTHSLSTTTPSTIGPSSSIGIGSTHDITSKAPADHALPPSPSPSPRPFSPSLNQVVLSSFNPGIPLEHQPNLNVLDLSLMHHWSIATWSTVSNRDDVQQLWRLNIPTLATQHAFLMHAVLAVSAMHLHSTTTCASARNRYLTAASQHHERAVRGIAPCLAHISRDNCDAVVATSGLVAIYSFLTSRIAEIGPADAAANTLTPIGWVPLLRGVHSILEQAQSWVHHGPLSPLLAHPGHALTPDKLDAETERSLQSLYRLCTDLSLPGADELAATDVSTAYFSAIAELRKSFATISKWDSIVSAIFRWPIAATDRFVQLLLERRPRALVIFVHYCVLFTLVEGFWWATGSARFELERCEAILGLEWRHWIDWPRKQIMEGRGGFTEVGS